MSHDPFREAAPRVLGGAGSDAVRARPKITYRCPTCGGPAGCDAYAAWDEEAQAWTLGVVYDAKWCNDCGELGDDLRPVLLRTVCSHDWKEDPKGGGLVDVCAICGDERA